MTIFPAIDLSEGKVVRLRQGDFKRKKIYQSDPLATAQSFEEQGASHLHIVDLDGAKRGAHPLIFLSLKKLQTKRICQFKQVAAFATNKGQTIIFPQALPE